MMFVKVINVIVISYLEIILSNAKIIKVIKKFCLFLVRVLDILFQIFKRESSTWTEHATEFSSVKDLF